MTCSLLLYLPCARSNESSTVGASVASVKDHLSELIPGLSAYGFSKSCARWLFRAPNKRTSGAKKYSGVVNAGVPKGIRNNGRNYDDLFHVRAAIVKGSLELVALYSGISASGDEMSKQNVGTPAVSRHHQLNRMIMWEDQPVFEDHDFPKGSGYKLEASGYMILSAHISPDFLKLFHAGGYKKGAKSLLKLWDVNLLKRPTSMVADRQGRPHVDFSHQGESFVITRSAKCDPTNAAKHCNDMDDIIGRLASTDAHSGEREASIVALVGDNGPTWSMKSMLVLFFYFRLFKTKQLDVLIVIAHRAGCSAHNWWIEHLWSYLSKQLSGKVYDCRYPGDEVPPCRVSGIDKAEVARREKFVFERAAENQSAIWNGKVYNKHPVTAEVPSELQPVFSNAIYRKVPAPL
jgi:hypothetical protein